MSNTPFVRVFCDVLYDISVDKLFSIMLSVATDYLQVVQ